MTKRASSPICPRCGAVRTYEQREVKRGGLRLRCKDCYLRTKRARWRREHPKRPRPNLGRRWLANRTRFQPAWAPKRIGQVRVGQYVLVAYRDPHFCNRSRLAIVEEIGRDVLLVRGYINAARRWNRTTKWVRKTEVIAVVGAAVPGVPVFGRRIGTSNKQHQE